MEGDQPENNIVSVDGRHGRFYRARLVVRGRRKGKEGEMGRDAHICQGPEMAPEHV